MTDVLEVIGLSCVDSFAPPDPLYLTMVSFGRQFEAAGDPAKGTDPDGLFCVGPLCTDQAGHIAGQIGNHKETIAGVAGLTAAGALLVGCAVVTSGVCIAAADATILY